MKFKAFLLSLLAVFAPIKGAVITVGILVFSDLILGIWAAIKRKEVISSSKMRNTISKLIIFEICLLLAYLTEIYLIGSLFPISKIAASYIGLVELQSIIENLNDINGSPVFVKLLSLLNKKQDEIKDDTTPPDAA